MYARPAETMSKEQEYIRIFQRITRLISMVLDHQQVMDLIVSTLPELLDVDAATIRLLDTSTNTFVLGAAHGLSMEYLSRGQIDSADTMEMIRSGHPVARTRGGSCKADDLADREGIKSVLSLPILFQDSIIGIMRLLTRTERVFTSEEINFAMALAEQVGIAISFGRMLDEMENQVDFMKEVQEISTLVNSTLDLDEILSTIVRRLPRSLGRKACTIRLLEPRTGRLELVASHGLSREYLERGGIESEQNTLMALAGEPVAIFDVETDERIGFKKNLRREGIRSLLAVPIKVSGEVIGVLRVLSAEQHCFTSSEINFAVTVAEAGGAAIQNARTYRKVNLLFNQIEENERFLANILDCIRVQLLVVDPNMHVVQVNQVLLDTLGKTEGEVLGRPYSDLFPDQECKQGKRAVDQVLATGRAATCDRTVRDNGTVRWEERTASPMLNSQGEVEYVIEVIRDVTLQRKLEEEKMERTKLQGVVELAGTVAHEINSPLFAALGTAQLLEEDLEGGEHAEDVATIIRNLKAIGELTGKMATMTGFESRDYVGEARIVELK